MEARRTGFKSRRGGAAALRRGVYVLDDVTPLRTRALQDDIAQRSPAPTRTARFVAAGIEWRSIDGSRGVR